MRKVNRSKEDEKWLKGLGSNIEKLIKQKGYDSPYNFWIEAVGDDISRSALNYILNGRVDVKVTTIRKLANALGVEPAQLLKF